MKINAQYDVPANLICSLIVGLIESNPYADWFHSMTSVNDPTPFRNPESDVVWYGHDQFWDEDKNKDMRLIVRFDDPADEEGTYKGSKTIFWADLRRGMEIMATKYPTRFADVVGDNTDAITSELWMQCILFGEEVYA